MALLHGINQLLFPPRCLGCKCLSDGLCLKCSLNWKFSNFRRYANSVSIFSSVPYTLAAANILLAAKEEGIRRADDLLVDAIRYSLSRAIINFSTSPILIPIPSTPRAIRRRGRNFIVEMAERVGTVEGLPVRKVLLHNRSVKDQSLLKARARFENLAGALSVISRAGRGREVLLIDDLVTTGSTLYEAKRALKEAGFEVLGAITACVSLPLR